MISIPRLYAIADASFANPVDISMRLFEGGARWVQIRNKRASSQELLLQTEDVLHAAPRDATVLVNDRADVTSLSAAGGVHLGQDDLPVEDARRILGPGAVIGLSTHSFEQAIEADRMPVDYIAVGPIFPTSTKENPGCALGLEELRRISGAVQRPVVAIGGITLKTVRDVLAAGAASIAVISALLKSHDITAETRTWMAALGAAASELRDTR